MNLHLFGLLSFNLRLLLGANSGLLFSLKAGLLLVGEEAEAGFGDHVSEAVRYDLARTDCVVVARDHEVNPVRVTVRVD